MRTKIAAVHAGRGAAIVPAVRAVVAPVGLAAVLPAVPVALTALVAPAVPAALPAVVARAAPAAVSNAPSLELLAQKCLFTHRFSVTSLVPG